MIVTIINFSKVDKGGGVTTPILQKWIICLFLVRKLWESCEKVVRSCGKVVRKLWESCENVIRKLQESCEKVIRKSREIQKKVMRKSWESHEKVYLFTPDADFADTFVLVCSFRWVTRKAPESHESQEKVMKK